MRTLPPSPPGQHLQNSLLPLDNTMDAANITSDAAPAAKLPTLPSEKNLVKEVHEEVAYFILTAVDSARAHLPNSRGYGDVVNQLFHPMANNSFHGRYSRWSNLDRDRTNIKSRAEHIIKTFHSYEGVKFPSRLQLLAHRLFEEKRVAEQVLAEKQAAAREKADTLAKTNLQREGELGMLSRGTGVGIPSVAGASENQLRQLQAAASTLGKNPVLSSTTSTNKRPPTYDDSSDEEELSFLYSVKPAAGVVPPVVVTPSPATIPTTTANNAAALLPSTSGTAGLGLLPPVNAIVGNGQQANNQALNVAVGLAAGGGNRQRKKKTISESDASRLTRERVDHIDSLDCINNHINASASTLRDALNARNNQPGPKSGDVNAQLFTLGQRRKDMVDMGLDTSVIDAQIARLNVVYNSLIVKEMGGLF